jgi:hypothetical protein
MWFLILVLVLIVLLGAGIVAGVPSLLQWLAKENILFTTVKEGTVKAIMRGDSFDHFIMSFRGYHLNDPKKPGHKNEFVDVDDGKVKKLPDWEIIYHGVGNKKGFVKTDDDFYDDRHKLLKKLGLYWVGWPWANSVYVYGFEWNETYTKEGKEKVLPRAEATDFIYAADFTYAIMTEGAETKDRLPTDELTLVTVAIRNPYRALFSGEDWIRRITAAINRYVRNFVGNKGYDELISITKGTGKKALKAWAEEFSQPIINLSNFLADETDDSSPPTGLKGKYGVEIRTADLQTVELSGSPEEKAKHQTAAARVYTAKQEAEATFLAGEAQGKVIKIKGDKEAEALEARLAVIEKHPSGEMLAQLDAMREAGGAGARVIWANSPFIPKGDEKK